MVTIIEFTFVNSKLYLQYNYACFKTYVSCHTFFSKFLLLTNRHLCAIDITLLFLIFFKMSNISALPVNKWVYRSEWGRRLEVPEWSEQGLPLAE
jgi:hypothetical protein